MIEVRVISAEGEKGRSFRGVVFAYADADGLWEGGDSAKEVIRPIYALVGSGPREAQAFIANLRLGKHASDAAPGGKNKHSDNEFEFLRSAGYRWAAQRHPEGNVYTVYMRDLFAIDPGMVDPLGVKFAMLPTRRWAEGYPLDVDAMVEHAQRSGPIRFVKDFTPWSRERVDTRTEVRKAMVHELALMAPLWLLYLDRRTRCPLVPDPRFALQVLLAALGQDFATTSMSADKSRDRGRRDDADYWGNGAWRFAEHGMDSVGQLAGLCTSVKHDKLEPFLAEQVAIYYSVAKAPTKARPGRGKKAMAEEHAAFRVGGGAAPAK